MASLIKFTDGVFSLLTAMFRGLKEMPWK